MNTRPHSTTRPTQLDLVYDAASGAMADRDDPEVIAQFLRNAHGEYGYSPRDVAAMRPLPEPVDPDYDPIDAEQGPLERGWAHTRRLSLTAPVLWDPED